jgi:uncharacterized phage protein gp47/JayE
MSLTTEGFERPRLNEIKADYDQRFTDALGPVNTNADAVVGQIIGIFAAALDDAYEALQNTYDSMYPSTAEGTSLDGAVSFVGLERIGSSATSVVAMCYGIEGTLIPAGALTRSLDNRQYAAVSDSVISRSNAGDVLIEPNTITNGGNYQIIAGGVSVVYTADASATAAEITAGLAALFNPVNFVASALNGVLRLRFIDLQSGFTLTCDSKLTISTLSSPVTFECVEPGAFTLPANALTTMDSSIAGWDSVNNLVAGAVGHFVETDEELRIRHSSSVRVTGAATVKAIKARLLAEVPSVSYVSIFENRTNSVDAFGLPAHSFETIVAGGTDQAIAEKLFEVKPAGIETFGNTDIQVIDSNGDAQTCSFSRATDKFAWIKVTINSFNTEETLSTGIAQKIKDAVVAFGNTIGIGNDIIIQKFFGAIYEATQGLGSVTIELALTTLIGDTPTYVSTNVVVDRVNIAVFDPARVIVVGV